jgi:hypothetical protein
MITKTQLKAGLPFIYKSCTYTVNANEGYIKNKVYGYVGNILSIGTKSFTIYTYVMGKQVKVKVNYNECELVVDNE